MITVGMNYHVIAGKQKDFEDKFGAVLAARCGPSRVTPVRRSGKTWPITP